MILGHAWINNLTSCLIVEFDSDLQSWFVM